LFECFIVTEDFLKKCISEIFESEKELVAQVFEKTVKEQDE
jgi:hypothetical protein